MNRKHLKQIISFIKEMAKEDPEPLTLRKRARSSILTEEILETEPNNKTESVPTEEPSALEPDSTTSNEEMPVMDGSDGPSPPSEPGMDLDSEEMGNLGDINGTGTGSLGNLGGGGGGGGGGEGFSSDTNEPEGNEEKPTEKEKPVEPKDELLDNVLSGNLSVATASDIFKALRAAYFEVPEVQTSWGLIQQEIKDKGSSNAIAGLRRFEQYLVISETKRVESKIMKEVELTKEQIAEVTKKLSEKILKEFSNDSSGGISRMSPRAIEKGNLTFMADRKLRISAQQAAYEFEAEIRSELELLNPNEMPMEAQKLYQQAMEIMHSQIISATSNAIAAISKLPKIQKDKK